MLHTRSDTQTTQSQHGTVASHRLDREGARAQLGSDVEKGLTAREARQRLSTYGRNELPEAPPPSPFRVFFSQFSNLIIWVLIGAAVISGLLQEWVDAIAIHTIVGLNAILGFVQEFKAERALAALRKLSVAVAVTIRDGVVRSIPARELVPHQTQRNISCGMASSSGCRRRSSGSHWGISRALPYLPWSCGCGRWI